MKIGANKVNVNDFVESSTLFGIFRFSPVSLFFRKSGKSELSVLYFEVVIDHGVFQPVQGFHLSGTQRGLGGDVSVQCEFRSLEVLIEAVHPPGSGGCLQEESCVVFLVLFQLSRGMRDDLNLAQVVPLDQVAQRPPEESLLGR